MNRLGKRIKRQVTALGEIDQEMTAATTRGSLMVDFVRDSTWSIAAGVLYTPMVIEAEKAAKEHFDE